MAAGLLATGAAGSDWPQLRSDSSNAGVNPSDTAVGVGDVARLGVRWMAPIPGSGAASSPVVAGGTLFIVDGDGRLTAVNEHSGTADWSVPAAQTGWGNAPVVFGGAVYVAGGRGGA